MVCVAIAILFDIFDFDYKTRTVSSFPVLPDGTISTLIPRFYPFICFFLQSDKNKGVKMIWFCHKPFISWIWQLRIFELPFPTIPLFVEGRGALQTKQISVVEGVEVAAIAAVEVLG